MVRQTSVIGVPSSAGSYAAGQEQAPKALRSAGLLDALVDAGLDVIDEGDMPEQVWKPDRANPYAQNVDEVRLCLQALADGIAPRLADGNLVLVLGGNCSIALAVIAGLRRVNAESPGLLYIDRHFDLNTPLSTTDGALDWMGLAHAFSLPGCIDKIADAFEIRPLLDPGHVAWLGVDLGFATEWERRQAAELELFSCDSDSFASDPEASTAACLDALPDGPLAVHLDVDVLNFTDAPLAENTDGRNTGPNLDQLSAALAVVADDARLRALSIGELNPTRSVGEPDVIRRFVAVIARMLGRALR